MVLPAHWVNMQLAGQIDPLDRGLVYGDGLFETLRYEKDRYHLLQAHMERLQHGCKVLEIPCPESRIADQFAATADYLAAAACGSATVRLLLTRGNALDQTEGRGYGGEHEQPSVVMSAFATSLPWRSELPALTLRTCEYQLPRHPRLAGIKHCNRLDQVLAARELRRHGFNEGLLYDLEGHLISGVAANVFLVLDGVLVTPELSNCGIAGTVRDALLSIVAPRCGLRVAERSLGAADIQRASEIFLTSSLQGVRQVAIVDGVEFPEHSVTDQLRHSFCDWSEEAA
ncbi:aminodeoxychorismate lyase [Halieaceae bacterium IMCC14734]|uniref:Aminodeoxychorismate lyase n=1 Tax=Candidatus Litorirhabdus singularis TaxID=2518993 RepID=A0ABT3TIY0_9GAMM|nr:aminodeoxychorismate lyase [Candidatus Litorirhabdus singularis]MCX2981374.1 aminodeoxychorismate lyase [Candidatus Litorirhabdus singularis]